MEKGNPLNSASGERSFQLPLLWWLIYLSKLQRPHKVVGDLNREDSLLGDSLHLASESFLGDPNLANPQMHMPLRRSATFERGWGQLTVSE